MSFKSSFTIPAFAAISFCLICATSPAVAYADLGDQLAKLLADDGAADDHFGFSVAISGATAIVGTWHDDDNGSDSGSAYLFDVAAPPAVPPTSTATAPSASPTSSPSSPTGGRVRERNAVQIDCSS